MVLLELTDLAFYPWFEENEARNLKIFGYQGNKRLVGVKVANDYLSRRKGSQGKTSKGNSNEQ